MYKYFGYTYCVQVRNKILIYDNNNWNEILISFVIKKGSFITVDNNKLIHIIHGRDHLTLDSNNNFECKSLNSLPFSRYDGKIIHDNGTFVTV